MATTDVCQIIYGSSLDTIDLLRGPVRLMQDSWSPRVARLRESDLGNQPIYEDVDEKMTLQIVAAAGDDPGAILARLQRVLADGRRWLLGDPAVAGYPPRLRVRPAGSRLSAGAYYEAIIVGGSLDNVGDSYTRMLEANGVVNVEATIRRRGGWASSVGATKNDGPRAPQTIHQVVFSSSRDEWSTASIAIVPAANVNAAGDPGVTGVLLISPGILEQMTIWDWVLAAPAGVLTNQAAAHARGGSFVRWAPVTATTTSIDWIDIPPFVSATPYITCKVPSGGPFQIRLVFGSSIFDDPSALLYTEWITVSDDAAQVVAFQPVHSGSTHDLVYPEIKSLAAGTFEIDSLVIQKDSMLGTHAIRLVEGAFLVGTSGGSLQNIVTIWHDPLQDGVALPAPVVGQYHSSAPFTVVTPGTLANRIVGYLGDAAIHVIGSETYVLPLFVEGTNFTPMAGASQCNLTVQMRRRNMSTVLS